MAEKEKKGKKKEAKKVLERTYNAPLRKEWSKAPDWRRAKKAVNALKAFVAKHMKSDNVKIGKYANLELWKHGIRNPPHHIKVDCVKFDDGKVIAELAGAPKEEPKEAPKHAAKKEERPKTAAEEKIEEKVEEAKEEKAEKAKEIEKEEIDELKKEHPKTHHLPKETTKQPASKEHRREMIPGR